MKKRSRGQNGLQQQPGLTKARLLLHLLAAPARSEQQAGSIMVAGVLMILALVVGTLGLVAIVNGSNLASLGSGESRDAQQVAEAGADQIIATFNQPENRQLLVAGSTPPNQWSTTNMDLQSPCVSTTNVRPGVNGDGMPSARAVNFANGQFRNLENVDQVNQGDRRFVLRSIRYSAGNAGSTDRRAVYRTFDADGTVRSQAGTIPTGTRFNSLLNLDDPDGGSGALRPGTHSGYIAVTVEGRLYRPDGTFSTSTITKEFEVVPKCCGGSFGSNASGGSTTGASAAGDLGADSRFCGIEFGMITGINGGRFFSQLANDRYTRRNSAGQVVNIGSILGVIADPTHTWDRTTDLVVGGRQVGFRMVPNTRDTDNDLMPGVPAGNLAAFTVPSGAPNPCPISWGDAASIAGRAASCIPVVPLYLSTGLPSISSKYTYNWTPGGYPDTVSKQTVNSTSKGGYPQIVADVSADASVNVWIRGNGANSLNQVTPGPFLEYCNTKWLTGNACSSVFNGSNEHTWAVISRPGAVTGGIGDDFASNSLSGYTANSTPRWPTIWEERDSDGAGVATGDLIITGGQVTFRDVGGDIGTNLLSNAPAIARAVNLYGLQTPVLEFTFSRTGAGSFTSLSALKLDYSFGSGVTTNQGITTDSGWLQLATVTANGNVALTNGATGGNCSLLSAGTYTCRIGFPQGALTPAADNTSTNRFSHFVKFRLRANSNFNTGTNRINTVSLDNIAIKSSTAGADPVYRNVCEYSSSFPVTANFTGGFHCLGPSVDMISLGNVLWIDTSDYSTTFYYNRATDTRGINGNDPLINLVGGATMANVICTRSNPLSTAPVENCKTLVPENEFNPVGEYDRFNMFGRDTAPGNNCTDLNLTNQPCNQIIAIGADSSASSSNRSRIAGAWFYFPWGLFSFAVNGCSSIPAISAAEFAGDDSWNFGGRLWARTIYACGQNHFRVPPSASSSLTQLVGVANSADVSYIGWEGVDWVARTPTAARKGFSLN